MSSAALVAQLCRAWLTGRRGAVAVIRMFVDESGIHDGSPVIAVAAYIARPLKWQKFTSEWRRVIRPAGIDVFHATDCNALQGAFKGWDREERDKLVARLMPIVPRYAFGYAVVVKLSEVEAMLETRPELRKYHRDPYQACFQWVLHTVLRHLGTLPSARPVAVVHEINDYQQSAIHAFNYVRESEPNGGLLLSLTFGSKAKFVPLQAADTLAYESARRIRYQDGPERRSLKALYADGRVAMKSFNRDNIAGYIEMLEKLKQAHDAGVLADRWRYDA